MGAAIDDLTSTQRQWLEHIRRCDDEGNGTKAYAEAHGIKPANLYAWRGRLRRLDVLAPHQGGNTFIPVVLGAPPTPAPAATSYRLCFPNGLILEWENMEAEALAPLVARLARLS